MTGPVERSSVFGAVPLHMIADNLISARGQSYAKSAAPISPNPVLTGNRNPGTTALVWLKGHNKCNQFVGDVLTYGRYAMPMFRMPDGSFHYMNAEKLVGQKDYFKRITSLNNISAGDLVILDWDRTAGENGAHVEMITRFNPHNGAMRTVAARKDGASETDLSAVWRGARFDPSGGLWRNTSPQHGPYKIYVLRPTMRF